MKFKSFLKIACILIAAFQLSCRNDFSTVTSNGNLRFSTDTLFLDTVFNNLSTTTQLLKVYNTSNNDVIIPKIELEKSNSKYRINVDGASGTIFNDVLLLKNDSLYVFVETTTDNSDTDAEMIYRDKVLFDADGSKQSVALATLIKDATFLFTSSGTDFNLTETNFTNTKPYIIYGNAIVPENGTLAIDAGASIYFSENASLNISKGATLNINGTLTDSVVFKGDKLSYVFKEVPGQWQGININNAATVNINHLKVLNPVTGFNITNNTNNISIKNTEIYNAGDYGIYTENANITGENIVIGQSRKSNLYLQGGDYTFNHCTFANFWSKGFRSEKTISLANYYLNEDVATNTPLNSANYTNCIVAGAKISELFLDKSDDEPIYNFNFKNCLLKIETGDDLYDTNNSSLYTNCILNKKEDFRDTRSNDLRIGLENEGINQADITTANTIPLDIIGTNRTIAPDIGAYQHIDFKTLETE